ncbi:MAG: aminotransferase class V-fold PLP-dependent enzyme [Bacteroidota bacterium]
MKRKEVNSSRMPVYRDSGFELYDAGTTSGAFKKETEHEREPDNYIYSRYRNPTVVSAEEEIMKIEGCSWALLTQSGMSAIDTALSVFQYGKETRPWLFFTEIYGGTISFIESVLKKQRGLDIHYFTPDNGKYDLNEFEKVVSRLKPEFVYIESISNPMLIVADVTEITRTAKKHGSKVIIDNTFATPWLYKPLDEGVDIVIHSATKYFSGHGNLTAGVICGNDKKIMQSAIEYRKFVGHMLSPDDAYRLQTQIQSFELRFTRQCDNASKLAEHLSRVPVIKKVWFPGLKSHPTHNIAEKLFGGKGFGAMITFDFDGKDENEKRGRRDKFIKLVSEKIKLIPTLGDPHTILMPVEAVWGIKYPEPGMIRLSVGFEDYGGLETTITKALNAV